MLCIDSDEDIPADDLPRVKIGKVWEVSYETGSSLETHTELSAGCRTVSEVQTTIYQQPQILLADLSCFLVG